MDLKRYRALSKNKKLVQSNVSFIKLLDYAEQLEAKQLELSATIVNLGTRHKRLLNWVKSIAGMSSHGISNLSEYECLKKSSHTILKERRELLDNEK